MDTILENGNYRVTAQRTTFDREDIPLIVREEILLHRFDTEEWDLFWESNILKEIPTNNIVRAANRHDLDSLQFWLDINSPSDTTYHVSEHETYFGGTCLYIVKNPPEYFEPSASEPVCWVLGNTYRLELTRTDSDEILLTEKIFGLHNAGRVAGLMIADYQDHNEPESSINIVENVASRFLFETDPDRRKFLMEELNYWLSKSLA